MCVIRKRVGRAYLLLCEPPTLGTTRVRRIYRLVGRSCLHRSRKNIAALGVQIRRQGKKRGTAGDIKKSGGMAGLDSKIVLPNRFGAWIIGEF